MRAGLRIGGPMGCLEREELMHPSCQSTSAGRFSHANFAFSKYSRCIHDARPRRGAVVVTEQCVTLAGTIGELPNGMQSSSHSATASFLTPQSPSRAPALPGCRRT